MNIQPTLFDTEEDYADPATTIPGLSYRQGFLDAQEQRALLHMIDQQPWGSTYKRRTQHYGYSYDYLARRVDRSMYLGGLPDFATSVVDRLMESQVFDRVPEQMLANEYLPGQGIAAHIDCEPCFANTVALVSLGWAYEMDFISVAEGEVRSILLMPGSLVVIADEARYEWAHRIRARLSDRGIRRRRRVSVTFRNVNLDAL